VRLEVPMRTERFGNMTDTSVLRMQLDSLEVLDVFPLEEHVSDGSCLFVNFERVTREHDTFRDDTCRIGRDRRAHRDEVGERRSGGVRAEKDTGGFTETNRTEGGEDGGGAGSKELLRLVDVVDTTTAAADVL